MESYKQLSKISYLSYITTGGERSSYDLHFFILMFIFAAWILTIGIVAAVYKAKHALNIWLKIIGMGGFLYPLAIAVFLGIEYGIIY